MAQIRLRDYLAEVEQMIDDQRLHEAAAHCRYVLQRFPRHLPTYRLLGKAFLEQQEFQDATDIFQRVLSADPEDFVAHVGMAIAYKEDALIAQAAWHMERAFESEPYNPVIRDELMNLYATRDDEPPDRLLLNRAALARLYVRSGMYDLAVRELQMAVREDTTQRVDLQVLLAEALWRGQQRVDAVDVSLTLLDQLPNCMKANAIVSTVWLDTGRTEKARPHLERLQALVQPERAGLTGGLLAHQPFQRDPSILPEHVSLEWMEYLPDVLPEGYEEAVPDWVNELNFSEVPEIRDEAAELDELASMRPPLGIEPPDSTTPRNEEDVPGWLRDIAAEEGGSTDWLQEMAAGDHELETIADLPSNDDDDVPYWLSDILDETERDPTTFGTGELYDFLNDDDAPPAENPLAEDTTSDLPPAQFDEWHADAEPLPADELSSEAAAAPAAPVDASDTRSDELDRDMLSWLADDVTAEEQTMPMNDNSELLSPDPEDHEARKPRDDAEDGLDWLRALSDAGDAAADDDDADKDLPDWLQSDVLDELDEEAVPDWLQPEETDVAPLTSASAAGGEDARSDAPDEEAEEDLSWLDAIASGAGPALEEPPTLSWTSAPDDDSLLSEEAADAMTGGQDDDELANAMTWLEDLAMDETAIGGAVEDDADSGPVDSQAEVLVGDMELALPEHSIDDQETIAEDELDDAMSWLEELASQAEEPAGVPPAVEQKTEIMPDDVMAAEEALDKGESMAWLDELTSDAAEEAVVATGDVTPDMDTEIFEEDEFAPDDEDMAWLDELTAAGEEGLDDSAVDDEPESPSWLQALEAEADSQIFDLEDTFIEQSPAGTGMLVAPDFGAGEPADAIEGDEASESAPVAEDIEAEPEEEVVAAEFEETFMADVTSEVAEDWDEDATAAVEAAPGDASSAAYAADTPLEDLDWLDDLMAEEDDAAVAPAFSDPAEEPPTAPSLPLVPSVTDEQLDALFAGEDDADFSVEEADEPAEWAAEAPTSDETVMRTAPVIIDGQEIPDLDMEATEDPVDEDDALSWLQELVDDATAVAETIDEQSAPDDMSAIGLDDEPLPSLETEPALAVLEEREEDGWAAADLGDDELDEIEEDDWAFLDVPTDEQDAVEDDMAQPFAVDELQEATDVPVMQSAQVVIDGQVIPDLDIEATADPVDEDDAMAWLADLMADVSPVEADDGVAETEDQPLEIGEAEPVVDDAFAFDAEEPEPTPDEGSDDIFAAMADSEPEELDDFTDALLTMEEVDDFEIAGAADPEEMAEAMAWLEGLMAEEEQLPEESVPQDTDATLVPTPEPVVPAVESSVTNWLADESPDTIDAGEIPEDEAALLAAAEAADVLEGGGFMEAAELETDESSVTSWLSDRATPLVEPAQMDEQPEFDFEELLPDEALSAAEEFADEAPEMVAPEEPDSMAGLAEEIPEDPDEAMRWLESMAEDHEAEEVEEDLDWLDDLAAAAEEPEPAGEMTMDEFAAATGATPDWLSELAVEADEPDTFADEADTFADEVIEEEVEAEEIVLAGAVDTEEITPVVEFAEEFEFDDEPALDAALPDQEMPEPWDDLPDLSIDDREPDEVEEAPPTTAELVSPDDDLDSPTDDEALTLDLDEDPVAAALPDWLLEDANADSMSWMDSLTESSVTNWLSSEDEATLQSGILQSAAEEATLSPLAQVERDVAEAQPDAAPTTDDLRGPETLEAPPPGMDAGRLDAARQALQERDYAAVLDSYGQLLDGEQGLAVIIDDLEQASSLHREPRLVRLLGDAYMRDGQLQKAIDSYRRALDLM